MWCDNFFPMGPWFPIIYYYLTFIQNIQKWLIKVLVYSQFIVMCRRNSCCSRSRHSEVLQYINGDSQRLRPILPSFRPLDGRQQEFTQHLIMICEYVLCLLYSSLQELYANVKWIASVLFAKGMSDYPQSSIQSESMYFVISDGLLCFPQQKKDLGRWGVRYDPQHRRRAVLIFFILHVHQRVCQSLSFIPLALKCNLLQNRKMLCSFVKQVICLRFAVKTGTCNTESAVS